MIKGQKSVRGGIEDFLCPFENFYLTCGPNESKYHKGIQAIDVRGSKAGAREAYYAPATSKCIKIYPSSGQAMWQTVNNVRCSNGYIGKVTYMTVHDDSFDAYVGLVVPQGNQLGNMGTKGNATGVHCHIEFSQSADTTWTKNSYGNYMFNNEVDPENVFFMDGTKILNGIGAWKNLKDVPVNSEPTQSGKNYVNLPPTISKWNFYDINVAPVKANAKGTLNPQKFGGLSYYVYEYRDNGTTAVIETVQFGKVKIYIKDTCATITVGSYKYQNGNH